MLHNSAILVMALLYGILPLAFLAMGHLGIYLIIPTLIAVSVWCVSSLPFDARRALWDFRPLRKHGVGILVRFFLGVPVMMAATYSVMPGEFMSLPRQNPSLWLAICLLYPVLSVFPQEVIYRVFLFSQLSRVLPKLHQTRLIVTNAVVFGYAHVAFGNVWAPLVATLAGLLFASTYQRTGSVICVAIEHALWGTLIFTIGMGTIFGSGTVTNLLES
jgi:membrane protease YdiL (CAAX protease family)